MADIPMKKIPLIWKIVIAIVLGAGLGFILPECGVRALKTINVLFAQVLKFIVPLLILGLVTPSIADLGKGAGKMLMLVMGSSYLSTVLAGFWAFGAANAIFPRILVQNPDSLASVKDILPYFTIKIPPVCDTLTALCLSFMTGLGIVFTNREALKRVCADFGEVVRFTINRVIVPGIPVYILTMVSELAASGKITALGTMLVKVIGCGIVLTVTFLIVLYVVAGLIARRNPFKALWTMLPAYLTGFSLASSSAVIPVTLECTKRNQVDPDIAEFTVPLCANVHLVGAMIKVVMNSIAVMWIFNKPIDGPIFVNFILMVGITAIAAPGVTGGTLMASLGLMDSILGLTAQETALVMTFYLALDGYGPAANVTGDGAIALIAHRFFGKTPR